MYSLKAQSEQNRRFIILTTSGLVFLIGFIVLLGWVYNISLHLLPTWTNMKPNTAACFIFSSVSLFIFYTYPENRFAVKLAYLLAFLVTFIGFLTCMEYLMHKDFGIDTIIINKDKISLRMTAIAAFNFLCIGIILLLCRIKSASSFIVILSNIILIISLFTLFCSVYRANSVFNISPYTAFAFVIMTFSLIVYHSHHPFLQFLLSNTSAAILGRRLLITIMIMLPLVGYLELSGQALGWYDAALGTSLMIIAAIIIFIVTFWLNILFLTQTENKARELISIIESSSDAIISLTLNGNIRSWNKGAENMYGYVAKEVLGKNIALIAPKDRQYETLNLLKKFKKGELNFIEIETIRQHKNGSLIPVAINISAVRNAEGEIIGIAGITRNISERKRIDRMKNEFVSIVSHELRTPLTSIQGSLSLLIGGLVGDFSPKAKQLLQIAKQNSERLIRLINDILDIQKIEAGKIEFQLKPLKIPQFLEEAVIANQSYGDYYGITKIKLQQPLPKVYVNGDHDRLLQVITNLISNAVKYSPEGEIVTVSAYEQQDRVIIAVKDQGPGIDEEFRSKIFQKFAQADSSVTRERGGTGLGLNISRAIIENMHGDIYFETEINKGTTFYISLPILKIAES